MKRIIFSVILSASAMGIFAQNAVKDGSFESLNSGDQLPRIAQFTDFGNWTQTANPTIDATAIVQGEWYRKASNTAYLKAVVTNEEAQDGNNALLLSINPNSGQQKLDNWYANTLVQFLSLNANTEYTITFHAKAVNNADRLYVGLIGGSDFAPLKGTKWVNITPEWAAYSVKVKTKSGADKSGVIWGLAATYGDNDKTVASSVYIDNISVTITK